MPDSVALVLLIAILFGFGFMPTRKDNSNGGE
jgi:hypothetical protein